MAKELEINSTFTATEGLVVGKEDGQRVVRRTRDFTADSKEAVVKMFTDAYKNETLDINLSLDKYICAGFNIVEKAEVTIDGKVFTNTTTTTEIIGDKEFFNYLVDAGEIVDTTK